MYSNSNNIKDIKRHKKHNINMDLSAIKTFIENMSFHNQKEFIKLLIKHNIPSTENKNGTFINITELTDSQMYLITQFISHICEEEKSFNEVETTKKNLKLMINSQTDNI
tara:strand:- start:1892 stop:2221 length:330 start_codon:yes stop_codon:yes gene_type:complete